MRGKSELHLIIPGIGGPLADTQTLESTPVFTQWIKTLSKSTRFTSKSNTYDVVADVFNLDFIGDFPSAALSLYAKNLYDNKKYYMHADPVHLRADMDHAVLTSCEDLNINGNESVALRDALNQHFNQDGFDIIAVDNNQWFVAADCNISMNTTPLVDAIGRNVNFILPKGDDSTHWKQLLTEAQMLMFSHEVNTNRDETGQSTINSLWFHGCGALPEINNTRSIVSVCGNQHVYHGIAKLINCDYSQLPLTVSEYTEHLLECDFLSDNMENVLQLSVLEHLVNYTDVSIWLEKLEELLVLWVYPLLNFAKENDITVTLYDCNNKQYQFEKYDSLRFWRSFSKQKVGKYVDSY